MESKLLKCVLILLGVAASSGCGVSESPTDGQVGTRPAQTANAPAHAISEADFGDAETWGAVDNVVQVKHLFFAGQPDRAALEIAKQRGVTTVINLREPGEMDWDEQGAAAELGLDYHSLPVAGRASSFDAATFASITELVMARQDEKVLVHCSSSNRAGAWFAAHLVQDHGMEAERSIELARKVGLTNASVEARVRRYLYP